MNRWVVFDHSTSEAAQGSDRNVELRNGNVAQALNEAVQAGRTVVVVVPAGGEQATVARITPPDRQSR